MGPHLNDRPPGGAFRGRAPTVSPGETLTIYGHWYTSTFTPAGQDLGFSTTVVVPAGTPTGTAKVRDDRAYPATYEFEIGK